MIDGAGSDGYARAGKNEVCEKKNSGFRRKHFRIIQNLRRRALSSSKTGGLGLTCGALVRDHRLKTE
jgi:hypothetical protein